MSLKHSLLAWINDVRRQPALGSDPTQLKLLERAALNSWEGGFAAQHAPIAPLTWEVSTLFLSTQATTERVALEIPQPIEIVGFFFTLEDGGAGGATTPTLNSYDVAIDIDQGRNLTSAKGRALVSDTTTRDGNFVTMAALHLNAPRLFGLRFEDVNSKPTLGFTFRSKRGTAVYRDTLVRCATFARPLR